MGYRGMRYGVRGYEIWGTRVWDMGYKGMGFGVQGYEI